MRKCKILIIIGVILTLFFASCSSALHIDKLDWESKNYANTSDGL